MNSTPKPNLPADLKPDEKAKSAQPGHPANEPKADPEKEVAK